MNLAVGQKITVTISDLAFGGEGVGRVDDFVVFVPFVIPGETVEVEITEVKKNFARARPVQIVQASPDRVEPLCPYFAQCGGCDNCRNPPQLQVDLSDFIPVEPAAPAEPAAPSFEIGTRVKVPKYDEGTVVAVAGDQVTIAFETDGEKTFLAEFVTPAAAPG